MTFGRPLPRLLIAAAAAFGLTFAVLAVAHRSEPSALGAPPAATAGALPSPRGSTAARVALHQRNVRERPRSPDARALLAAAYLQRARETGDPALYGRADGVVRRALALAPDHAGALTQAGVLALARHDFRAALSYGQRARRAAPDVVRPLGVVVDAQVELGRYGDAARTLQRMVDSKPNLDSYARVSYLRELRGDLPGAVAAMRLAASAGGETAENVAYVQTLLGHLELARGRVGPARAAYRLGLQRVPGYLPARAGLARADAARGRLDAAIRGYRAVVARLPLPEHVIALGEAELAAGRPASGRRTLALVGAQRRLLEASGIDVDVELAVFEADHGSPARAVALARRAWAGAPSVRSADALGWALTRGGRPRAGLAWARRALRLGTRDPAFLYHAGMAARAAGRPDLAERWLRRALAANPRFSPLHAPRARRALRALEERT